MSVCDPAKWSCPICNGGITVYGSQPDQRCSIRACQLRHAQVHREAADLLKRLGMSETHPPRRGPKRTAA